MTEIMDRRAPVQRRSATEVGRSIREVLGLECEPGAAAPPTAPVAPAPTTVTVAGKRRAEVSRWRLR